MEVLNLTLKKKWFDMIASGEKTEEYREIKPYFQKMFEWPIIKRNWDVVTFRNGYKPDSPRITVKFLGVRKGEGNPAWGAESGKKYFVIKLGEQVPS